MFASTAIQEGTVLGLKFSRVAPKNDILIRYSGLLSHLYGCKEERTSFCLCSRLALASSDLLGFFLPRPSGSAAGGE